MMRRLVGTVLSACAAAVGVGGGTATAVAQGIYYGDLTAAENTQVRRWSEHYWAKVEGQSASPGTGFSFASSRLNSHLFNPVRSGRPTLEALDLISAEACDGAYTPEILNSAPLDAYRGALKDLMLNGEITTEVGTPENWYHELLILAADPELGWLVFDEVNQVITIDLPLEEVSGTAHTASLALNVSTQSQQIIATMIAAGQHWRNQCTDVPQWKTLITGETSTAEQFLDRVGTYLQAQTDLSFELVGLQATFGVFGELPMVLVRLPDCFVILDSTNGNISGPFQRKSNIDPQGLLSLHQGAYQGGSSIRTLSSGGRHVLTDSDAVAQSCEQSPNPAVQCNAGMLSKYRCSSAGSTHRCKCENEGTAAVPNFRWVCHPCSGGRTCVEGSGDSANCVTPSP